MKNNSQLLLAPEAKPATITVNGQSLLEWGRRSDVHIYRMDAPPKKAGIYVLHLLWLEGRALYRHDEVAPAVVTVRTKPLRGVAQQLAVQAAFEEFA